MSCILQGISPSEAELHCFRVVMPLAPAWLRDCPTTCRHERAKAIAIVSEQSHQANDAIACALLGCQSLTIGL